MYVVPSKHKPVFETSPQGVRMDVRGHDLLCARFIQRPAPQRCTTHFRAIEPGFGVCWSCLEEQTKP